MKIKLNLANRGCQLEFDAEGPKDAIKQLSAFSEVLSISTCGACGSTEIRFDHRVREGNDFFGMRCLACTAQLDFGQHKTGNTLFPRTDKSTETQGWYIYARSNNRENLTI